jgi:hypothetical protein
MPCRFVQQIVSVQSFNTTRILIALLLERRYRFQGSHSVRRRQMLAHLWLGEKVLSSFVTGIGPTVHPACSNMSLQFDTDTVSLGELGPF